MHGEHCFSRLFLSPVSLVCFSRLFRCPDRTTINPFQVVFYGEI